MNRDLDIYSTVMDKLSDTITFIEQNKELIEDMEVWQQIHDAHFSIELLLEGMKRFISEYTDNTDTDDSDDCNSCEFCDCDCRYCKGYDNVD